MIGMADRILRVLVHVQHVRVLQVEQDRHRLLRERWLVEGLQQQVLQVLPLLRAVAVELQRELIAPVALLLVPAVNGGQDVVEPVQEAFAQTAQVRFLLGEQQVGHGLAGFAEECFRVSSLPVSSIPASQVRSATGSVWTVMNRARFSPLGRAGWRLPNVTGCVRLVSLETFFQPRTLAGQRCAFAEYGVDVLPCQGCA